MSGPFIDHSVYPDREESTPLKRDFVDDLDRADYLERVCAAWDFDVRPDPATFKLFRAWKPIFDRFPLPHSPAYHTFRILFDWPAVPHAGGSFIVPHYLKLDRVEGRTDPCEELI